jgi:hypothetical protein
MMGEAAAKAASSDVNDGLALARKQLAELEDEFTRDGFEFGFDRHGWDAWRGRPQPRDLHADTAGELRKAVLAVLGRPVEDEDGDEATVPRDAPAGGRL